MTISTFTLLLASASPRRHELLRSFYKFRIAPADIDECVRKGEGPRAYVLRMAREKWMKSAGAQRRSELVVAADTSVILGREILGKAANAAEAKRMLAKLSGKEHIVLTAIAVGWSSKRSPGILKTVRTRVKFRKLSGKEISLYLRMGDWKGKAGAYAIQGRASTLVDEVRGSLSNVIGLPLVETLEAIAHVRAQSP